MTPHAAATATTIHPFEEAGLGTSPFCFVRMTEEVYSACPGHAQPAGTCDYCGQGIKYCCHIRAADGREFVVGCDCVRKVFRPDNRVLTAMEREIGKQNAAKRQAKRQAKWKARCEEMDRQLQLQRERNGGMTDRELQLHAQEQAAAKFEHKNGWLLDVLQRRSGEFCASMCTALGGREIADMPPRCIEILRKIYAESHGRRGSRKYDAACADFDARTSR